MKVLVTGANGFVGKNLIAGLRNKTDIEIYEYDVKTAPELLDEYCAKAEFVYHLAGVNRPQDPDDFMKGNCELAAVLLNTLKKHNNTCPVLFSSSIQAELDNTYGQSKRAGEELFFSYGRDTGNHVFVYRLPNVFGKWCRPNYNSVVATFCHNIANDLPIKVNDPDVTMRLVYVDDVVDEFICALEGNTNRRNDIFYHIPVEHTVKLGQLAELLYSFKNNRNDLSLPILSDTFVKNLYATYLSYLPDDGFSYSLKMNCDERGSFTELLRTPERGQFSVNITKPGITKGNHWHHSKNEKFIVVSGEGVIRFRKVGEDKILEYHVSGEKIEALEIPPGYTHNIENLGSTDLVTFMWCSECFDPDKPDTFSLEV